MGRLALLLALAAVIGTALLHQNGPLGALRQADARLYSQAEQVLARQIALSGLNEARYEVTEDYLANGDYTGPATLQRRYQNGRAEVRIEETSSEVTIVSEGVFGGSTYEVRARLTLSGGTPPSPPPPPFMQSSISVDNNLQIKDDFTVLSSDGATNAEIHANNNIEATAGTVYVEGFASYNGNINFNNGQTPEAVFQPVSNPDGLPVHEQVDTIALPEFDAEDYAHLATRTTGNTKLSGTVTLGTRENPEIWYVGGNLETEGDVTISGYGAIITRGNVKILHHVRMQDAHEESTFALYTGNDLKIDAGSLTLEGQFLVGNNLQAKANTTLAGSITVGNDFQTHGPFTNVYRPASSILTDPFWPSDETGSTSGTSGSTGGTVQLVMADMREFVR